METETERNGRLWMARRAACRRNAAALRRAPFVGTEFKAATDLPQSLSGLIGRAFEFSHVFPPCVYFLIKAGRVVYVGQSKDLRARIEGHLRLMLFDRVVFIPVDEANLDEIEAEYIRKLRPRQNKDKKQ